MSIAYRRSDVPEAAVGSAAPHQAALLRRLMIMCPATGIATDTGFELSAVPAVSRGQQWLVDCLECGQDHPWHLEDAFLE